VFSAANKFVHCPVTKAASTFWFRSVLGVNCVHVILFSVNVCEWRVGGGNECVCVGGMCVCVCVWRGWEGDE
jgi:hypothetical protein